MEIRQLKYFLGIAECGSFSEASRKFFLSQSAISQQIKALEEEFKTTLFHRTSHKVELTENGKQLLPLAREIVQQVNYCEERMAEMNKLLGGELNIGLTHALEPYIRKAMLSFMKQYPHVHINVYYKTIPEMIQMLKKRLLDVAFSILVEGEEDWVTSTPILEYRHCAFMRDTHPLADRTMLTFRDLERQWLILPEKAQRKQNAVDDYLGKSGVHLQVKAVINDPCAILCLLKESNYISILSEQSVKGIDELVAVPIQELSKPVICFAHQLKGEHQKRSTKEFLHILQTQISNRAKWH